ncbi:hypothetical protein OQA88_416 [Cercophora sp. LCS_1]
MAVVLAPPASSTKFVLSRAKIFLALSLAATWWFASILPSYQPVIKEKVKARLEEARQSLPSIKVDWKTSSNDPRDAYSAAKVALLIEPRPLPHLVPQILHMISVVPPDWRFLFIGSEQSVVTVGRAYATKYQQVIGKLDLMVLPEPWNISSKEHVYRTVTDPRFYAEFLPGVEWLLKYESDSILCSNSGVSLNDWLHFDWVGTTKTGSEQFPSGGGLTLRRISTVERVLGFQARYNDSEPEDEWFRKRVTLLPDAKIATGHEALAVEDAYREKAMGYHIPDGGKKLSRVVWDNESQRKAIFKYCPEVSLIMDMRLTRERCWGAGGGGFGGQTLTPSPTNDDEVNKAYLERVKKHKEEAAARVKASKAAEEAAKKKAAEDAAKNANGTTGNETVTGFANSTKPETQWGSNRKTNQTRSGVLPRHAP